MHKFSYMLMSQDGLGTKCLVCMNVRLECLFDIRSVGLNLVAHEPSFVNCNITIYINKLHHWYRSRTIKYEGIRPHERERGLRDSENGLS
jgi:hypothetical protein